MKLPPDILERAVQEAYKEAVACLLNAAIAAMPPLSEHSPQEYCEANRDGVEALRLAILKELEKS